MRRRSDGAEIVSPPRMRCWPDRDKRDKKKVKKAGKADAVIPQGRIAGVMVPWYGNSWDEV